MEVFKEQACGSFGGISGALTTYPLDTIKTRLQGGIFKSVSECIKNTIRREGLRGFYRGFLTPVVSQPLYIGSAFGGFALGRHMYDLWNFGEAQEQHQQSEPTMRFLMAGTMSGICCATAVTPGERIKVLLQAQVGDKSRITTVLKDVVKSQEGWTSLFRGLPAVLSREIPGCMIWFGTYDFSSRYLEKHDVPRPIAVMGGGACAAMLFWSFAMPLDRVKTIQQKSIGDAGNLYSVAQGIWKTQGTRGFFIGFGPVLFRGVCIDIIQFSVADRMRLLVDRK